MNKIDTLQMMNETVSNHLFDCYRLALDYGVEVGNLAIDAVAKTEDSASLPNGEGKSQF